MYKFLGTSGHGKDYHGQKTDRTIQIEDHDGHTDFIEPFENYSELEVVKEYYKLWKRAESGIDFQPVLVKAREGRYNIEAVASDKWIEDEDRYDTSKIEGFIAL